jgi:chemotaxis protein methyltransferase CheR
MTSSALSMDDVSFARVLQFFSLSWQGYRKVRRGVKKRVARHMLERGCRNVDDYLLALREHPQELQRALELLTVPISRFFRDRLLWETFSQSLIPRWAKTPGIPVRVWSAGCACGEEVYSLKIVWDQVGKRHALLPPLEIWATDLNPLVLAKARTGVYPLSSLRELCPALRGEYFVPTNRQYALRQDLQQDIHWLRHDLVGEKPPVSSFDIIFLRNNLLTYYESTLRDQVFSKVLEALRWEGYLIIGNKEQIPPTATCLTRCRDYRCVFRKSFACDEDHPCN